MNLLPIREAYEWKLDDQIERPFNPMRDLLPIREAYEWKPKGSTSEESRSISTPCFQFVKRMNGNPNIFRNGKHFWVTCFQFVKRMNGNTEAGLFLFLFLFFLLPIREAYEWKPAVVVGITGKSGLLPIREAYEWKLAKQDDGVNYAILASNS